MRVNVTLACILPRPRDDIHFLWPEFDMIAER